jgi:hypothetical protein
MALRAPYRPLRSDLDSFLFAPVGNEIEGVPLSMISALARLGLDPWQEAGRLSSLSKPEAVEQLARLIMEVPDTGRSLAEAREIAGRFIGLLPGQRCDRSPTLQVQIRPLYRTPAPRSLRFWLVCFALAAMALVSMIVHGGFPFGML